MLLVFEKSMKLFYSQKTYTFTEENSGDLAKYIAQVSDLQSNAYHMMTLQKVTKTNCERDTTETEFYLLPKSIDSEGISYNLTFCASTQVYTLTSTAEKTPKPYNHRVDLIGVAESFQKELSTYLMSIKESKK